MKKTIKKATSWLMIVCMVIGFVPVFGSAAAAEDKPAATAVLAVKQPAAELDEMGSGSLFSLLMDLAKAIEENLRKISIDELLKLPSNVMDDVVTYIVAILKVLGVNIDSLYEKISHILVVQ